MEEIKPPTDIEIETEVYSNTGQEISPEITAYINGMKDMRDKWLKAIEDAI
jgi:hypothetical protein